MIPEVNMKRLACVVLGAAAFAAAAWFGPDAVSAAVGERIFGFGF